MPAVPKLTAAQAIAMRRIRDGLSPVSGPVCERLVSLGLVVKVEWLSPIYRLTERGRAALERTL